MSKNIIYMNSIEKRMNPFLIGYMVNPKLYINKAFRSQDEKFLKETFHSSTHSGINM